MSDTPMVDDRWQLALDVEHSQPVVLASFARQLERELNEYKKKYIDCSMALKAINQLSECKVAIQISNRALSNETKPTET